MISYAQNFEDVMLWRAFKGASDGFYIDIGAQHPVVDSVSKSFYEAGWRGVHVEPVPEFAELLRADRPDEDVLQFALGNRNGMLDLFTIPGTGLSTQVKDFAERHLTERNLAATVVAVPVMPASVALKRYAGRVIHWMKLDVEGAERDVLEGWNFVELAPWVILVEATEPNSQRLSHEDWEPIVLDAGYKFAYWDGLNRFYVRSDQPQLLPLFSTPPNVFDGAALAGTANAAWHTKLAHDAYEQSQSFNAEIARLRGEQAQLEQARQSLHAELNNVKSLALSSASDYGGALASQRTELDQLISELTLVRQGIRDSEQSLARHSESNVGVIAALQSRSAELEGLLKHERDRSAALASASNVERERIAALHADVLARNVALEGELATLNARIDESLRARDLAQTRITALEQLMAAEVEQSAAAAEASRRASERHASQFAEQMARLDALNLLHAQSLHQNEKLTAELVRVRDAADAELARVRAESVELAKWVATAMRDVTQATERLTNVQRHELNEVRAQASRARLDSIQMAERQAINHREALDELHAKAAGERETANQQQNSLAAALAEAQNRAANTERHLGLVLQSRSWRYTRFVRWALRIFE